MALVPVIFRAMSDDPVPVPVDDVVVKVFDAGGSVFVTEGTTGVAAPGSGEVILTLTGIAPGTIYTTRVSKDGWSFLPGSNFLATVYDPVGAAPNNNDFQFTAHQGLVGALVTLAVKDDAATPQPVESVQMRVFDAADVFLTEGETGAGGELKLVLPGGVTPGTEYLVRLFKAGVLFPGGLTQRLQVIDPLTPPESNIFDFTGQLPSTVVSSDPDMCLLSGYLVDAALRPMRSVHLRFNLCAIHPDASVGGLHYLSEPTLVRDKIIVEEALIQTDKAGYVEVALPRGAVFDFTLHGSEGLGAEPRSRVYIPDLAGVAIQDVLFPYVTTVDLTPTAAVVSVGEEEEVEVDVYSSNLQPGDLYHLVEFTSADEEIATAEMRDGTLFILGVAAGNTTIKLTRLVGSYASRRPDLTALEPLTVEVT